MKYTPIVYLFKESEWEREREKNPLFPSNPLHIMTLFTRTKLQSYIPASLISGRKLTDPECLIGKRSGWTSGFLLAFLKLLSYFGSFPLAPQFHRDAT